MYRENLVLHTFPDPLLSFVSPKSPTVTGFLCVLSDRYTPAPCVCSTSHFFIGMVVDHRCCSPPCIVTYSKKRHVPLLFKECPFEGQRLDLTYPTETLLVSFRKNLLMGWFIVVNEKYMPLPWRWDLAGGTQRTQNDVLEGSPCVAQAFSAR